MQDRVDRLESYERWGSPRKIDFEKVLGTELWAEHWSNWSAIIAELRKAQELAKRLQLKIAADAMEPAIT